ncbi:hypothetical protein D3C71_52900 [compost metagenome]
MSPYHAMACNPSTLTDPLGLYVKGEAHNGAGVPQYGNEMAMRFPTLNNFMARQRNFIESAIQKAEAQRQLEWMAKYDIVAYAAATGSGARFEETDARTLLMDLQSKRAYISGGRLIYYKETTEITGEFGYDPELGYNTYLSEITYKREVADLAAKAENVHLNQYSLLNLALGGAGTTVSVVAERLGQAVKSAPTPRYFNGIIWKDPRINLALKEASVLGRQGRTVLKSANYAAKGLGTLSVIMTVADGVDNGFKNHHFADIGITLITTFAMSGPWGWAAATAFYVADAVVQARTGKSITEHVFD